MSNTYTPTKEMDVVWNRFFNKEKPTVEELDALYEALKEKKAENAQNDVLAKIDDPAYSRPKKYDGFDSTEEAEAFSAFEDFKSHKIDRDGLIYSLKLTYVYD